jgi:Secretion system C-terminal sorting domain
MCKKITFFLMVTLILPGINSGIQAQTSAYAYDGGVGSYGTVELSTGIFTTINFGIQGSYFPISADNDDTVAQYVAMSDYSGTNFFLAHMNFTTLTQDSIGPIAPLASGQTQIKALAYNAATDLWYLISGDDFASSAVLYTIDINTGALTEVGNIQNATAPVALAIDCDGNAYIVNAEGTMTTTAVLYSLNLSTAAATQVGTSLGFDNVTFNGQDMDFDPETGDLYWSAYWSSGFFSEGASFRLIDVANGTSTEITPLGEFDNYVSFSVNAICAPLPVELSSFSASANGNSVTMNWTTATEINNSGFDIERSADNNTFNKIGFVPGFGTTTESKSYTYMDNPQKEGTYYYRLKQVDLNGTFKYSNTAEVNVTSPMLYSLEQNYPNPFNPTTQIDYSIPNQGFVNITVFNELGQKVATLVNEVVASGKHTVEFNATRLSSGIYFYRIQTGSFVNVKKMNLLK